MNYGRSSAFYTGGAISGRERPARPPPDCITASSPDGYANARYQGGAMRVRAVARAPLLSAAAAPRSPRCLNEGDAPEIIDIEWGVGPAAPYTTRPSEKRYTRAKYRIARSGRREIEMRAAESLRIALLPRCAELSASPGYCQLGLSPPAPLYSSVNPRYGWEPRGNRRLSQARAAIPSGRRPAALADARCRTLRQRGRYGRLGRGAVSRKAPSAVSAKCEGMRQGARHRRRASGAAY